MNRYFVVNRYFVAAAAAVCLGATLVMAASPQIEAAMKTLGTISNDPAKLKLYCDLQTEIGAMGEKEDQAAEERIEGMIKQLGPEFETAWTAADTLDETSADAKEFYAFIDQIESKCP
jgi:hypothetical protein